MEEAVGYQVMADDTLRLAEQVAGLRKDRSRLLTACIRAYDALSGFDPSHPLVVVLDQLTDEMCDKVAGNV